MRSPDMSRNNGRPQSKGLENWQTKSLRDRGKHERAFLESI